MVRLLGIIVLLLVAATLWWIGEPRAGVAPAAEPADTGTSLEPVAPACVLHILVVGPDADSTPGAPQRIYVACAHEGWQPAARAIPAVVPGVFVCQLALPAGTVLEYKFNRDGTWSTVEKAADGGELPNRHYRVPEGVREVVLVQHVAAWADRPPDPTRRIEGLASATRASRPGTRTGDIRVHPRVRAPQFDNERDVLVWLPPGYDDDVQRRYPVAYLLDGQNVFDAATSFSGVEWQADETAARLIAAGIIEPLILVAVGNTAQRFAEYTPAPDARHGGGGADDYLAFIESTLKPLIDGTYRTQPQPEHTAIIGASVAGIFAVYAPCRRPDLFGLAASLDPSLWWADEATFVYVENQPLPPAARVWFSVGTGDVGDSGEAHDQLRRLSRLLAARGADVQCHVVAGGQHHERDWAEALNEVLRFLFPPAE